MAIKSINVKFRKILKILSYIFSVSLTVLVGFTLCMIAYLNVLPFKYLLPTIILGILIITGIILILIKKKFRPWLKIGMMIISFTIIIICFFFCFYMVKTFSFLDKINRTKLAYTNYYIIVNNKSNIKEISDIKGNTVSAYNEGNVAYTEAIEKINTLTSININEVKAIKDLKVMATTDKNKIVLMSKAQKDQIELDDDSFSSQIRIIYTIKINHNSEESTTKVDKIVKDVFTIYVSGIDAYGDINSTSRSDVNMLVTINPNTSEILLTSIPRDYYVQLHNTTGYKDKLTHAGIYGINMSIETIEDLLDIDVNYYIRVNFSTLIKIVDLIGGINVYSDTSFKPWTNRNIFIKSGNIHMNGEMALAFSRERHAYLDGDRHRLQNQQDVISAIIKKMVNSPSLLTKYTSLLDSVSDSFQTNINKKEISSLIKLQLDKMPTWTIKKYSLNGGDSYNYTYSFGMQSLYVMIPNDDTVIKGHNYISGMKNGNSLSSLGL